MIKRILFATALLLFPSASHAFPHGGGANTFVSPTLAMPTGNLEALYSMAQQNGYSGHCMDVTRGTGGSLTVGFVSGFCDLASAFTFGAGTTLSVQKIYDQSGNARDLPCTSFPSPSLLAANSLFGLNGPYINTIGQVASCTIPTSVPYNTQSLSVYTVDSPFVIGISFPYQVGSSRNSSIIDNQTASGTGDQILQGNGSGFAGANTSVFSYTTDAHITALSQSTTATFYWGDNKASSALGVATAITGTGGVIGGNTTTNGAFVGNFYLYAQYSTPHGSSVSQSIRNNLTTVFSIPTITDRVIYDGDSIHEGTDATGINNNEFYTLQLLKRRVGLRNISVFGQQFSSCLTNEFNNLNQSYDSSLNNIVIINAGTNDMAAGTLGADLYNNSTLPYVSAALAKGYKVIIGTVIYRTGQPGSFETQRQIYNGLVRSGAVANGYTVADYDSVTQLQNPQTAGYSADGTHPTSLGYSVLAPVAAAAINADMP